MASSEHLLHWVIAALQREFSIKDLGPLHYFLSISITCPDGVFHLSQWQFILEILARARMADCKPCSMPIDISAKLSSQGSLVSDPMHYRGLAGALHYLTFTYPDIAYAVQHVCLHMQDLQEPHYAPVKRILCYL